MAGWILSVTEKFEITNKWYEKKQPNELKAVLANLDMYVSTLNTVDNPLQIKAGFIHPEPHGVIAIDQKGGKQKVKLKQTRLYLFPEVEKKAVHLLIIGDKNSQAADIKYCNEFIKEKRKKDA